MKDQAEHSVILYLLDSLSEAPEKVRALVKICKPEKRSKEFQEVIQEILISDNIGATVTNIRQRMR